MEPYLTLEKATLYVRKNLLFINANTDFLRTDLNFYVKADFWSK